MKKAKKIEMVAVPKADLDKILQYNWRDEERNYAENKPCPGHIFLTIKRLDQAAKAEQTALDLLKSLWAAQECDTIDEREIWRKVAKLLGRKLPLPQNGGDN